VFTSKWEAPPLLHIVQREQCRILL